MTHCNATRVPLWLVCFLIIASSSLHGQDLSIPDNPYDTADEATKERKAFLRERWFYEQRMYPFNRLPDDAFGKAMQQRDEMRRAQGFSENIPPWTNLGPTPGYYFAYGNISGRTTTVQYDPNNPGVIYIGAAFGGVWKSTNGGNTWTAKTDFEASLSSGALAIDPTNTNIVYYGTGEATYSGVSYYGRGLLKSTDGGETWTHYTGGLQAFTYFSRIVVRPGFPNQLLAALGSRSSLSASGGIYRSTNGGVTWSALVAGRADDVVFSPSGDTAYAVGSGVGYRISTNGGQTFSSSSALTMQTRNHIAISNSNPSILYAATHAGSSILVFKSTDAGASFSQVAVGTNFSGSQAWYDFYIHVNPFDPEFVYVGSIDIWRSTNGGTNFQNITNGYSGGYVHVDQHNVGFHPTNLDAMISVNDGGVWRSSDRGTSWTNLNSSLTLTQFYRITSDPSNASHILGGTQDNGTQRTMGTTNWAAAFGGDGGEVCFHSQNPSRILGETQYNGIYRSTNGGASWSPSTSGLSGTAAWVGPILSHPDSADIFYTARQSVFKSVNGGAHWSSISTGISGTIREMAISKSDPQIMFATIGFLVYRSINRGYNWSLTSSGLPARTITSVTIHPDSANVVLLSFSGFGTGKVYRSSNTGNAWTNITGNLPDAPTNNVLIHPTPGVYIAATDVGVFITSNFGSTWAELAAGLPSTVAMNLDYHYATGKLRVGTHGRGVYETTLEPATFAITSPAGGETWPLSSIQNITWSSSGLSGNVKIELSRNAGVTYPEVLFANTANDGSEQWIVTGPVTGEARIRVTSLTAPAVTAFSNASFSVVIPSISVVFPNGGEVAAIGDTVPLSWSSLYHSGQVRALLSRDGGATFAETLFTAIPDTGSILWAVTGPPTTTARIRIESEAVAGVLGQSTGDVTIAVATVAVVVPNGGETLLLDSLAALQWSSSNAGGQVNIELSRDGGSTYDTLFVAIPNTGSVSWTVTGPTTAAGRLRVSSVADPSVTDMSDNAFSIIAIARYTVVEGWNLLSLPVTVQDLSSTTLFPSAVSPAYMFSPSGGYFIRDSLVYGKGYWVKFNSTDQFSLTGGDRIVDTVDVVAGWNLIGSITYDVPVDSIVQIPPGIVETAYFGYDPPYTPKDSIAPGRAYWVKVSGNGRLILHRSVSPAPASGLGQQDK